MSHQRNLENVSDGHKTTSAPLSANDYPASQAFSNVNNEYAEVDELILDLADYKNDYANMAAEKLLRMCSRNWKAYQYLQDGVHDAWLPNSAGSNCERLYGRYGCDRISSASTGGR